ncbi:MAG: PDZ domain-containing protein [Pyrinomonadaceae bacterium]
MLIRSFAFTLIIVSSFVIVTGQTPDAPKPITDPSSKNSGPTGTQKLRDLALPGGIDLQLIIKELARDLDINVLFDRESFQAAGRKTFIELKNVTAADALDYIFLQEGLYFEKAGPNTILVAVRAQQHGIPLIGAGVLPMSTQLAQYFGVEQGILVNSVRNDSSASKAGLKAGDVIVEVDGAPVNGPLVVARAIDDKKGGDIILKVVRDRKVQMITLTPQKGIQSIL